jgi:hypothetical protein
LLQQGAIIVERILKFDRIVDASQILILKKQDWQDVLFYMD